MSCVFYGENTLDKSLFKKQFYKNTLKTMDLEIFASSLTMVTAVQISIDRTFKE